MRADRSPALTVAGGPYPQLPASALIPLLDPEWGLARRWHRVLYRPTGIVLVSCQRGSRCQAVGRGGLFMQVDTRSARTLPVRQTPRAYMFSWVAIAALGLGYLGIAATRPDLLAGILPLSDQSQDQAMGGRS